jgi:hypothetical protein
LVEKYIENIGRLGWIPSKPGFKPVRIIETASGCDTTIAEHEGLIKGYLGVLDDSTIVEVDPTRDKIIEVSPSNGNGFQRIIVEFHLDNGVRIEKVFIPTK